MNTSYSIDLAHRLLLPESVTSVELDGERVLLHIESGEYYGLNQIGAQIFEMAETEPTIEEVVASVQEKHSAVDAQQVKADILSFIKDMRSYDLLHVNEISKAT